MKRRMKILGVLLLAVFAGSAIAADTDLDYQRLSGNLDALQNDPVLGRYARAEQALAAQAVQQLRDASSKRRAYVLYIAERRVDLAKASAQLEVARHKLAQLEREHNSILLEASRRDAAATRRALERERLQNQLAAEETARLQAQGLAYSQAAEQARADAERARQLAQSQSHAAALARREAKLAESAVNMMRARLDNLTAKRGSEGMQMTLEGLAFGSGQASLRPEARAHLGKLVQFVNSKPEKHVRIEGFTDSSGNAAVNQNLSLRRAESVRDALVAAGVDADRISVVGKGESRPVASNDTAAGRAKNRRVVVILRDR